MLKATWASFNFLRNFLSAPLSAQFYWKTSAIRRFYHRAPPPPTHSWSYFGWLSNLPSRQNGVPPLPSRPQAVSSRFPSNIDLRFVTFANLKRPKTRRQDDAPPSLSIILQAINSLATSIDKLIPDATLIFENFLKYLQLDILHGSLYLLYLLLVLFRIDGHSCVSSLRIYRIIWYPIIRACFRTTKFDFVNNCLCDINFKTENQKFHCWYQIFRRSPIFCITTFLNREVANHER